MEIRQTIHRLQRPIANTGPFAGVPRWLFFATVGPIVAAYYWVQFVG